MRLAAPRPTHRSATPATLLVRFALPLLLPIVACGTVADKSDRFLEGTEPDAPLPTVPRAPGDAVGAPRVVLLAVPGLSASLVERGMREGWMPVLRRLRIDATWQRLAAPGPDERSGAVPAGSTLLLGAAGDPGAAWYVHDRAAEAAFGGAVPPGMGATVPQVGFALSGTIVDRVAGAGRGVLSLRWPVGLVDPGANLLDLRGGAFPDLSFGEGRYVFVRESPDAPARHERAGGVELEIARSTGGRAFDVFRFEVEGPPDGGVDAPRLTSVVEAFLPPDRSRARLLSSEDEVELVAGRWSEPLALRFTTEGGAAIFGRTRAYLRPTGLPRMELLLDAPDFDPVRPPRWQALSTPPELAAEWESRYGPLPGASSGRALQAVLDGVLDARDAAATLEDRHRERRRLLEEAVASGGSALTLQWLPVAEDAARLVAAMSDRDREVELFGRRIAWSDSPEAVASAVDEVVGALVAASSSDVASGDLTVVVVAPYGSTGGEPDPSEGWWAVTRLTGASTASPRLADFAPTIARLLAVSPPHGSRGIAWAYGPPMARLPEVELSHERFVEERDGASDEDAPGDGGPGDEEPAGADPER